MAVIVFAITLPASAARAQGTARSMDFELSIRSAGMAGASNAVCWGGVLSHWGNPATLGYARGIQYEYTKSRLVPGLANDVFLRSEAVKAGIGGVGVVVSGKPDDIGGVLLDYGVSQGTDNQGNPTYTFRSFETVDSWGFGVNVLEGMSALTGSTTLRNWSRHFDVSSGMNFKSVLMELAPSFLGGVGSTRARDAGALARVTVMDGLDDDSGVPMQVDAACGYSRLSYNDDARITFINEDQASRVTRHQRWGFAGRVAMNTPAMARMLRDHSPRGAMVSGLSPLISVTAAFDRDRQDGGEGIHEFRTHGTGYEIMIANMFAWRGGSYVDRVGEIDGATSGWMVALPIGVYGGARYERARVPQARNSGLRDVERTAWSAWIDPVAIWRSAHPPGSVIVSN